MSSIKLKNFGVWILVPIKTWFILRKAPTHPVTNLNCWVDSYIANYQFPKVNSGI